MDPVTIYVEPLYMPFSNHELGSLTLTRLQYTLYKHLDSRNDVVLEAPTGSGKTLTLLLNPDREKPGALGVYPNTRLLENQAETLDKILYTALNVKADEELYLAGTTLIPDPPGGDAKPVLRSYKVPREEARKGVLEGFDEIIIVTLSSKHLASAGRPRRNAVYSIAHWVSKKSRRGEVYPVVLSTPDTILLFYVGLYMDFDTAGTMLHNLLVAQAGGDPGLEKALEEVNPAYRSSVTTDTAVSEYLLRLGQPLFVDEYHLYSPYELDALAVLVHHHKTMGDAPIIFSSATSAEDTISKLRSFLEEHGETLHPMKVSDEGSTNPPGLPVKGPKEVVLTPAPTSRRGLGAWYEAGDHIPGDLSENGSLATQIKEDRQGRTLIILDRLNQVNQAAKHLSRLGLKPTCLVSIKLPACPDNGDPSIMVGSESVTQGVNLGRVTLGATGGASAEDIVQREGRIGRNGVSSKLYLYMPLGKLDENPPPKERLTHSEYVSWIKTVYPSITKRDRDTTKNLERLHTSRRNLMLSASITAKYVAAGTPIDHIKLPITRGEASRLLETIIGPPDTLPRLLLFRHSGFRVNYVVDNVEGEGEIGLILRNFAITGVEGDTLYATSTAPPHSRLILHTGRNAEPLIGTIVSLQLLLSNLEYKLYLSHLTPDGSYRRSPLSLRPGEDTLLYITRLSHGLREYISLKGVGALIETPRGELSALFL